MYTGAHLNLRFGSARPVNGCVLQAHMLGKSCLMNRPSHNSHSYRVLAIGCDVSQLSSGANLLTQAGYSTDLVVKVDQAVRRASTGRYHLAIVSATFPYDEQIAIRARLKQVRPNLPVLLLDTRHDTPDAFLAVVADCLQQKKSFRFGTRRDRIHVDPDTL
jgi:PleD family two-component response regulator